MVLRSLRVPSTHGVELASLKSEITLLFLQELFEYV